MYRKIVVGFNGGQEARDALAFAARLRADDGVVTAVGVYAHPGPGRGAELDSVMAAVAEEQLAQARADYDDAPWLRTVPAPGTSPAHGLHEFAEDGGAELIVVGSSHRGKLGRTLAGTTSHRLLNGSPCPVAIAPRGYRGRPATRIGVVVVGIDGTPESELALTEAIALATARGAELELVAVAEPPVVSYGKGAAREGVKELEHAIEEQVAERLKTAEQHIPAGLRSKSILAHGEAATELADVANVEDAVLVTGSRTYGPLRRVLLGSVSTALVNDAPCPVIVVPRGVEAVHEPELVADAEAPS